MTETTEQTNAQIMADRYRAMADWLAAHPNVPVDIEWVMLSVFNTDEDNREQARAVARAVGKAEKNYYGNYFELSVQIAEGVRFEWNTHRDNMCERRQVGERTIVHEAKPAEPERIEVVPVYEYDCEPMFAPGEGASA